MNKIFYKKVNYCSVSVITIDLDLLTASLVKRKDSDIFTQEISFGSKESANDYLVTLESEGYKRI
jgi:hypothetical protein